VITDDQLKEVFARIPARNLTVVLDACHSGTGTRDLSLSRPRFVEFEPGLNRRTRGLAVPARPAEKLAGSGGIEGSGKLQVTISGCRPDQTSADAWIREGFYAGALTYHLIENMKKAPPEITYHALMEGVVRDLQAANYTQVPQIKGDLARPVLGTRIAETAGTPFARVESVEGRKVKLHIDRIQQVVPGSIWAIFPPGETAFVGKGVGRVEVTRVGQGFAEALMKEEAAIQPGCRAREVLRGFKVEDLRVRLEAPERAGKAVRQALGQIAGGRTYQTGTKGEMPFQIRARGPAGRELVKVIATLDSLDLSSLQLGEAGGAGTRAVESGSSFVRQLARDLAIEPLETGGEVLFLPTERWATDHLVVETAP